MGYGTRRTWFVLCLTILLLISEGYSQDVPFYDPRENGGSMLDIVNEYVGEPLNVIISAYSHPFILTEEGFLSFSRSISFEPECLNVHRGRAQKADLGDAAGEQEELFELRQAYVPIVGTCLESVIGGNHFRVWKQNGTLANSGAWFLAASIEYEFSKNHMIRPDGYNKGRNLIVDSSKKGGRDSVGDSIYHWKAHVEYLDMIQPGNDHINHGIEQDGKVALLTVYQVIDV